MRTCWGCAWIGSSVTTNVSDFWRHIPAHRRYAIICLAWPNERMRELPQVLRGLFRLPELRSQAARMGKVVRASAERIQYYQAGDHRTYTLSWPD